MNELHELWRAVFRIDPPTEQQWIIWEKLHDRDIIQEALLQLAVKHRKMAGTMTMDHMVRFSSAVMNRLSKDKRDALARLDRPMHTVTLPGDRDGDADNRWNR
jgi:hypothetical protein